MTTLAARLRRPAGIHSLRIGDLTVSYVPDGAVQLSGTALLPDIPSDVWIANPEYLDDAGTLTASIGGLLVEQGDRALLIDAGFGPQEWPPSPGNLPGRIHGGSLLDNLATLGRDPATIETVAFTHLHVDHLGWAPVHATGSAELAFTTAEYVLSAPEWANREIAESQGVPPGTLTAMAPRIRTATDGEEVFPGVHLLLLPGHSAGHAGYVISSGNERLIAFGDALHSPIQVTHPSRSSTFDHDPATAATHRTRLVADLAQPGTTGFGIHFADVVFGTVGDSRWHPLDS